ncbi:MAG: hypothetical protein GOVbin1709_85 [Prokaryotic dsDNA virus sp.]|nr:MAG: hypothetical protein GOVbin1709_85 [Prokaryotic dsDNA virus sp.]
MSEFVKIKPVGDMITGSQFRIISIGINAATITCLAGDSLFTSELKEGDKVTFYNKYNKRNLLTAIYTVDSVTSNTVFVAKEIATLINNRSKSDENGKIIYKYATKEVNTYYNSYSEKRILKKSVVGFKEDNHISDISLIDVDSSLVDTDSYDLVSSPTPIKYTGTSANQKEFDVLGHYTGNSTADYKVEIDGTGAAQVVTVTCGADSSGSLNATGFWIYTIAGPVLVMIHVNGADRKSQFSTSSGEFLGGFSSYGIRRSYSVFIDENANSSTVATAVYNALNDSDDHTPEFTVSNLSSNTFRITLKSKGVIDIPKVFPSMTSTSTGISFTSADGESSFTDANFESDGLDSTVWNEYDRILVLNSEKNDGAYQFHSRTDGKVIIKGDKFVNEDADNNYPVIVKSYYVESCGFTFATNTAGTNCTFKWSDTNGETWNESTVAIKGIHHLNNNVRIEFPKLVDYTSGDSWTFTTPKPSMVRTRTSIEELDKIYKCAEVC